MLAKWKSILLNWINCYFDDEGTKQHVNSDSLLNIIYKLRNNNLDESISSTLGATSLQEFINEKYPEVKFSNGTTEPETEDDIYVVASLLLFFICVSSKDVNIKNAMCSKLDAEDQEIIMKFSKNMLERRAITVPDIVSAVTETCGQDIASAQVFHPKVLDTPPAVRSLYGEVRRLQAALDAERFDKNYLQDELVRSNAKIENLAKIKEDQKLELVNLRAKISNCCGQENESKMERSNDLSAKKLLKQIDDLEEKLVDTRNMLDEIAHERDVFKAKVQDLKLERDKWFSFGQQENIKVSQLAEQLDAQHNNVESLKEMIAELRQHNRQNGLDTSQLECDDPDVSVRSMGHNMSMYNEACANVIEVQLSEERAKIVVLEEKIQDLQAQIEMINDKAANEQKSLQKIISLNEDEIQGLKHRVNDEIEEREGLRRCYGDKIDKLHNEINELEQKIKDNAQNYSSAISQKNSELQTMHEEKLSLLQSLNDQITKLETVIDSHESTIKSLTADLYTEKNSKQTIKENYETQMMKLKEKVLNRNNELVELQNKIFEKGEQIEKLQIDLKKEGESKADIIKHFEQHKLQFNNEREELKNKINASEKIVAEKTALINNLSHDLSEIKKEKDQINKQKKSAEKQIEKGNKDCVALNTKVQDAEAEIARLNKILKEKEDYLLTVLNQHKAEIEELKSQINTQKDLETKLLVDIKCLNDAKDDIFKKHLDLNANYDKIKSELVTKEQIIDAMEIYLSEEKATNANLKQDIALKTQIIEQLTTQLAGKETEIDSLQKLLDTELNNHKEEILEKNTSIKTLEDKLNGELNKYEKLKEDYDEKLKITAELTNEFKEISSSIVNYKNDMSLLQEKLSASENRCDVLDNKLKEQTENLMSKLKETETQLQNVHAQFKNNITDKENEMESLKITINELNSIITDLKKDKTTLDNIISNEKEYNGKLLNKCKELQSELSDVKITVQSSETRIEAEQVRNAELSNTIDTLTKEKEELSQQLIEEMSMKKLIGEEKINLAKELEQVVSELNERKIKLELLTQECDTVKQSLANSENNIFTLEQIINEEKSSKDMLETEKSSVLKVKDELCKHLKEEKDRNTELLAQINALENQVKALNEKLQVAAEKEKCLQENITDRETKLKVVCDNLEQLNNEKEEIAKSLQIYEETMKHVQENNVDTLNEIKNKYSNDLTLKVNEIGKVKSELATLKREAQAKRDVTSKITTNINNKLTEFEKFLEQHGIKKDLTKKSNLEELSNILLSITDDYKQQVLHSNFVGKQWTSEINELKLKIEGKEKELSDSKQAIETLEKVVEVAKEDLNKAIESHITKQDEFLKSNNILIQENNHLKYVQVQLETKINSVKEKIIENDSEKEKLVASYELQIGNLNVMINKLSAYLKDKSEELETLKSDKEKLQLSVQENKDYLETLQNDMKLLKAQMEKQEKDFESERLILQNMVTVTESIMKDQKDTFENNSQEQERINTELVTQHKALKNEYENEKLRLESVINEKETSFNALFVDLTNERKAKEVLQREVEDLSKILKEKEMQLQMAGDGTDEVIKNMDACSQELAAAKEEVCQLLNTKQSLATQITDLMNAIHNKEYIIRDLGNKIDTEHQVKVELEVEIQDLKILIEQMEEEKKDLVEKLNEVMKMNEELTICKIEYEKLLQVNSDGNQELAAAKQQAKQLLDTKESLTNQITELNNAIQEKEIIINELGNKINLEHQVKVELENEIIKMKKVVEIIESEKNDLVNKLDDVMKINDDLVVYKSEHDKLTQAVLSGKQDLEAAKEEILKLNNIKQSTETLMSEMTNTIKEKENTIESLNNKIDSGHKTQLELEKEIANAKNTIQNMEIEKTDMYKKINDIIDNNLTVNKCQREQLLQVSAFAGQVIDKLEQNVSEFNIANEKKINELEEAKLEVDKQLEEYKNNIEKLTTEVNKLKEDLNEKDDVINQVNKELLNERTAIEELMKKMEMEKAPKVVTQEQVKAVSSDIKSRPSQDKVATMHTQGKEVQVDMSTSDLASSMDSNQTITDLERIIHDKNRTITTLHSDITYLKSLMAESENKLLDVTKELQESRLNCEELSVQLKKTVQHKNDEIMELKKQVSKVYAMENRASQIIKVSAKYQSIILKRIAEIKTSTVLKDLQNYNPDIDTRKSLGGNVTIEDLENFLESTDKHLKRYSEKQLVLQKERDRLIEINRINESELINLKKFLTELSVTFKTFHSVKEVYLQKLTRIVSLQRTVRRELLNLEGRITDGAMCKLERGYSAAMQDLSECTMNLERWVERSVNRAISTEKLKQAMSEERPSICSENYQSTSLEVQMDEMEKCFQRLLEELPKALKSGGKEPQAVTVMEVRAEYEDKLNRMKAKMKELFQEQVTIFREKQKEEVTVLERELQKTRDKLSESTRAYEEHIRGLTTELWSVSEKFLMTKDEADWLKKKQKHGSLMSLQQLPTAPNERYSDVSSLRSLPVQRPKSPKPERRGLHMSDEEGELFDNRWLHELNSTPRARSPNNKERLSELKWRNSLCPPHLKSSYPAETHFAHAIHEDDIKNTGASGSSIVGKQLRKEVGITAYKKPGPPTPSKQAGRLSATDSDLRESIRLDPEPAIRKTTTPSRLRSLFFSSKNDSDSTPRKRLSIFRSRKI